MSQKVFNRYEKKYLLEKAVYEVFKEELDQYMTEDRYGWHTIRNIYFDTWDDELIRTSIEKPKYKEKFRLRCYGQPTEDSIYFLEIKKKYNGLVNKRRISLPKKEAERYFLDGEMPEETAQIGREVDYFCNHYDIYPKRYIAYDRLALFGNEDPEFRVTFDVNIRSRVEDLTLENDEQTTLLMAPEYYLMEVKISSAMPKWFVDLLSKYHIYNQSFSKYGMFYKNQLKEGTGE